MSETKWEALRKGLLDDRALVRQIAARIVAPTVLKRLPEGAQLTALGNAAFVIDDVVRALGSAEGVAAPVEQPIREGLRARAICDALGFDPTNHHNAAKCPYCTPDSLAHDLSSCRASLAEAEDKAEKWAKEIDVWMGSTVHHRCCAEAAEARITQLEQALADQEHDTTQALKAANAEADRSARMERALERIEDSDRGMMSWSTFVDYLQEVARAALKAGEA